MLNGLLGYGSSTKMAQGDLLWAAGINKQCICIRWLGVEGEGGYILQNSP